MIIRTITDEQERTLSILDEIREGNRRTRDEIKRLQNVLKGGEKEAERLGSELVKMASRKARK